MAKMIIPWSKMSKVYLKIAGISAMVAGGVLVATRAFAVMFELPAGAITS
ncbi:unnamed protein product, partial [marine sediment metagenome]